MTETAKVKTVTNKGLIWIVVIEAVLLAIFILSGFNKANPYLVFGIVIVAAILVYLHWRKPKELDFYATLEKISQRHHEKTGGYSLDTGQAYAMQVTDDLSYFYLPMEAKTFEVKNGIVKGIVPRHLYKAAREKEKSRLFSESIKYSGAEARLKHSAEALNVDIESLGLE